MRPSAGWKVAPCAAGVRVALRVRMCRGAGWHLRAAWGGPSGCQPWEHTHTHPYKHPARPCTLRATPRPPPVLLTTPAPWGAECPEVRGPAKEGCRRSTAAQPGLGGLGVTLGGERGLCPPKASREGQQVLGLSSPRAHPAAPPPAPPSPALPVSKLSPLLRWRALRQPQSPMIFPVLTPVLEYSSPPAEREKKKPTGKMILKKI